ncbi:MAG: WD40/YVTN/BNR-like repeat-containing protein, partial [Bacteroidota bacterium]
CQGLGPAVSPSGGGGVGRITVIRVSPANKSGRYARTASGGIWKSTNYGQSWTALSDFLPSISIADIAINPRYPDSVYVATGDGYGYETGGGFWGGTYSAGVMVSPDGGITWNPTGLSFIQTNSMIVQRLVIKPDEPDILFASTRGGLFRSANGGITWSMARAGQHFDIEFHTTNPDTVFATDDNNLLWSTNRGLSWTIRKANLCSGRLSLALTEANPERIYLVCEDHSFYRSDDLGVTIQQLTSPTDANFYGYYDAVLSASPTNQDMVICGGMEMAQSFDGGNSWNLIASNVHVDHHHIEHQPNSGNVIYSCNDGGIYRSTSVGSGWNDISANLCIKQYYRIAQSSTNTGIIIAGSQDNGTDRLVNGTWSRVLGGDGMDCMVDPSNDQTIYASFQYGAMRRSYNRGSTFSDIAPSSGAWVTPFAMHPSNTSVIYAGYEKVYRSNDRGNNWDSISPSIFNDDIISLEVASADPDHIYAATYDQIKQTADGGVTWSDITAGLPVGAATITGIATSPADPLKVWVSLSGYSAGEKVYRSSDGGQSWTNVSGSLPNLPVNCIIVQRNSP